MTRSTRAAALAALCLGLLVPTTATQAQTATETRQPRVCQGEVLTLAWGAIVRDNDGPCRVETSRRAPAVRTTPPAAAPACSNKRSYLGGAIQICDDQPRPRSPR